MFRRTKWTTTEPKQTTDVLAEAKALIDKKIDLEEALTTEKPKKSKGRIIEENSLLEPKPPTPATQRYLSKHIFNPRIMSEDSEPVDYVGYLAHMEHLRAEANKERQNGNNL